MLERWVSRCSTHPTKRFRQRMIPKSGLPVFGKDHAQIKGSGTPADAMSHARMQAACGTRHGVRRLAPPSACGRARLPAFHLRFLPAGLSSRGLSSGPGFPKTAPNAADVPPTPLRLQRCTSRAGRNAGRHDTRAARVRTVSFRPRAPHSLRLREVPSPKASFASEIRRV